MTRERQVENLRLALLRMLEYSTNSKQPPYDPAVVEKICDANGTPTVFQELVQMMASSWTDRACTNQKEENARKHAVSILYVMCYSIKVRLDAKRRRCIFPCPWIESDWHHGHTQSRCQSISSNSESTRT